MNKKVQELPKAIHAGDVFEITTRKINYFTHGFFKYPCKFIPQIPNWAIKNYSKPGDFVIDPFAGSGTTLVEAVLNQRNGLAIDFDLLSQLLCKTKTTLLSENQISIIRQHVNQMFENDPNRTSFLPDLHNLQHWFSDQTIIDLSNLKGNIENFYEETDDLEIYNFLLVCFASIIKKCSFADDISPKPYVSSRIPKTPHIVKKAFLKCVDSYLHEMEAYSDKELGYCEVISNDARKMPDKDLFGKVALAVTSPPYINAFDYVRSLRLENAWLGFYGDTEIVDIKRKQIGTDNVPKAIYTSEVQPTNIDKLDSIVETIKKVDLKRAYIVWKFFMDLEENLKVIKNLLEKDGCYVLVVGDSKIRGVEVPTHQILTDLASLNGFRLENQFSYIIKNRYIRIPRSGQGGFIAKDWISVLRKSDG